MHIRALCTPLLIHRTAISPYFFFLLKWISYSKQYTGECGRKYIHIIKRKCQPLSSVSLIPVLLLFSPLNLFLLLLFFHSVTPLHFRGFIALLEVKWINKNKRRIMLLLAIFFIKILVLLLFSFLNSVFFFLANMDKPACNKTQCQKKKNTVFPMTLLL